MLGNIFQRVLRAIILGGYLYVAELLVAAHADVNAHRASGPTSLFVAAQRGYYFLTQFLVQQQADVNTRSQDGMTPLGAAVAGNHVEVARLLRAVSLRRSSIEQEAVAAA